MLTFADFPNAPPIRLELTEAQAAKIEAAKPPGDDVLILGYARRHPWPNPERFTLAAWFIERDATEAALVSAGIIATPTNRRKRARKVQKSRRKPAKNREKAKKIPHSSELDQSFRT